MSQMSKVAVWFDIPATDRSRAKQFYSDVFDFKFEDFELIEYSPDPHIKAEVSV